LDEAERHALTAVSIEEPMKLFTELWKRYQTLADLARARGDAEQAAEWERKRDAVLEELDRRAKGPGGLPPQLLQAIQGIAITCAQAGVKKRELEPEAEAMLTQMAALPAPLTDLAGFLRRLSTGELSPVPSGLPADINQFLEQVPEAVREAK
jgi:hypothetical protein